MVQPSDTTQSISTAMTRQRSRRTSDAVVHFLKRKPLGVLGISLVLLTVFTGVFADQLMLYPYNNLSGDPLLPPSLAHPMGTDGFGRDVLSRIIYGARVSIFISITTVTIATSIATGLGLLSAWFGGRPDLLFQRLVDAFMAVPALVLLLTIMSVLGGGVLNVIVALVISGSVTQSRIVRSAVLSVKEHQYIEAARAIGATSLRVMLVHILPNVFAPIMVLATVSLGNIIIAEATLSFLGFGVTPPIPSWGQMLSNEGRNAMLSSPWLAIFPGLAISTAVYGINMFGDALRDVLDPRLRGGR